MNIYFFSFVCLSPTPSFFCTVPMCVFAVSSLYIVCKIQRNNNRKKLLPTTETISFRPMLSTKCFFLCLVSWRRFLYKSMVFLSYVSAPLFLLLFFFCILVCVSLYSWTFSFSVVTLSLSRFFRLSVYIFHFCSVFRSVLFQFVIFILYFRTGIGWCG